MERARLRAAAAWLGPPAPADLPAATDRAVAPELEGDEPADAAPWVDVAPPPLPARAVAGADAPLDDVDGTDADTEGTVPTGVCTAGVETCGVVEVDGGVGTVTGAVGTVTVGTVTVGTLTVGTVAVGVVTVGTGTCAGAVPAPSGSPQTQIEIEVPTAATAGHQRRRSMSSP
jgi:hypothetical protein